jgi:hypothetical protein
VQLARGLFSVLALSLPLVTAPASAQSAEPDCAGEDATACGRRHFETGTQAFERGDFTTAAAEFQAAIAQRPHPVIRFNLALSLARLGRPKAAIEQLQLTIADTATDKELRARAEREQRSAEQALSRVTFRLADLSRERVELDGVTVDVADRQELAIDPGLHHVRVISGSSVVLDQDLELSPGERVELRVGERSRRIDVVVVPDPTKPTPDLQPAPVRPPRQLPPPPQPSRPVPVGWFYAGLGVTAVVTGVTVWSGLDTNSAFDEYERDLPALSQEQADARVADGHQRELRTNLLLAGSLLSAAGTAVLGVWFVDFGSKAQARASIGPQQLLVTGRF